MSTASQTESIRGGLGQGLYSLSQLRSYLAVYGDRQDAARTRDWLVRVLNPVAHTPRRPDYSFSDLISLFVVRELLRRGVEPRTIRGAERYLRRKLRTDRPYANEKIQTDGRHVFHDDEIAGDPEQIEAADLEGQQVMVDPIREQLRSVHYADGWASSWTPESGVVLNPAIQFGEPVVEGTRLRTADLAAVARAAGVETAARRLNVDEPAVRAAMRFEQRLASLT